MDTSFHRIVDTIYSLPLEEREELLDLLGRNVAEERRNEIYQNYLASKSEVAENELEFSSDIERLKNLL